VVPYPELDTPAVLVDLTALETNLRRMAERARTAGVRLRPHAKTHKSTWIARRQLANGAGGLSVAKLGEAEIFADDGVTDILIAYPIVGKAKLDRLRTLAERVRVILALDDLVVARDLSSLGLAMGRTLEVMVEVDSGLHRCGRPPGSASASLAAAVARLRGLRLIGLLAHAGHAYRAGSAEEREQIALEEARALVDTAAALRRRGIELSELSVGSTPTAASIDLVTATYPSITEMRPGTYVFNDVNQLVLGVAREKDCALRVLTTVVSRPARERMVIDAGSKTLAADAGLDGGYGRVVGHPDLVITSLSEEHGVVSVPARSRWRIGDRLEIIPNHACPVPNLAVALVGVRDGTVTRTIRVNARGKNR
jgi:D-serine deaminase-like pyridoxal phosphate-dependent protein